MAVRLRAVVAGQTGTSPTTAATLGLVAGDVQIDSRADVRSTLDCTITPFDQETGTSLWPAGSASILTPYGTHELFVERGVAFGGGAIEYVPLGYFRINTVEQDDAPDGPIMITASDRMSMVVDARLSAPRQYEATDAYGDVVEDLVTDAFAAAVVQWDDDTFSDPIGRTALVESDRYAFLRELVVGLGKVAYFDHRGVLVIRTPPDPGLPVWSVSRGERGVLVKASRSLSREGVYNGVLAIGEALDDQEPVQALAVDESADSPTLWGGPFGKIVREFNSPLLTSAEQCAIAAATVLRRSTGLPYNVDFSAVPNPALEPDDPIAIGVEGAPGAVEPTLIVGDSFSRTVADGMGTSESGHGWSPSGTQHQVNGGVYKRELAANTAGTSTNSSASGRRDVRAYVDVRVPVAAAGASLVSGIVLRYDGTDYFTLRHEFNSNGMVTAKIARHSASLGYLETATLVDWHAYSAGQWWTVCAESFGAMLRVKAWPRDEPEPNEWLLVDDSGDDVNGTSQRFGIYAWRVVGNTNSVAPQWEYDNWRVYALPSSPLRGGEVHIVDNLTIPLTAAGAMTGATREQTLVSIGVS